MLIIENILLCVGGITLFILGLKFMSENMENLTGTTLKNVMQTCTKNKYAGLLTGAFSTAIVQSSVATNIILVGFVSSGVLSFYQASAVIMGTNIGTTITAQLVSLSGGTEFNITAFSCLVAFIGLIFSFFKSKKFYHIGNVLIGFGMLFIGIDLIGETIKVFKNYQFFCDIFLVEDNFLLLLNGLFITAIVQSSSVVSSIIILLASNGVLTFENSMFLILGANIGTCLCVIVASFNKNIDAQRTAFFNLIFNIFGSLLLFLPLSLYKSEIGKLFMRFSGSVEREIANFHTLFNILVSLILLPMLKPLNKLICFIIREKPINNIKTQPKTSLIYK